MTKLDSPHRISTGPNQELHRQCNAWAARPDTLPSSHPDSAGNSSTAASPGSVPGPGNTDSLALRNARTPFSAVRAITHGGGGRCKLLTWVDNQFYAVFTVQPVSITQEQLPGTYLQATLKREHEARPNSGINLDTELLKHNVW